VEEKHVSTVSVLNAPLLEISATHIRELVENGKSIRYLVPQKVEEEILASRFYKKTHSK
jgi:nicotinate-nucleotide adenylyltransferase